MIKKSDWVTLLRGRYAGRFGHVVYEYANMRYAVRFGTPERWHGEVIVDACDLFSHGNRPGNQFAQFFGDEGA